MTTIRVEIHRLGDRMGDEADGLFGARPELQQFLVQPVAHDLVQRAEGFVHQQDVGVEGQRPRDRGALLHAARKLPGKLLLEAGQFHQFQHPARALGALGARNSP
jgi:hypothetical protein